MVQTVTAVTREKLPKDVVSLGKWLNAAADVLPRQAHRRV
jgi:hypothetical protein